MESSNSNNHNQGGGGGSNLPRHSVPPHSTKARQSSASQLQAQLNLQHMKQIQALNGYKTSQMSSNAFQKGGNNQSVSVTPKHTTMQQRALTQLHHQTHSAAAGQTHISSSTQKLAKALVMGQNQAIALSGGSNAMGKGQVSRSSAGASGKGSSSKQQADLQAKFASLLKLSKDLYKDQPGSKTSSNANLISKQDGKKVDKKPSNNKSAAASGTATKDSRPGQQTSVTPSHMSHHNRQTPAMQQMLIIQNTGSPVDQRKSAKNQNASRQSQNFVQTSSPINGGGSNRGNSLPRQQTAQAAIQSSLTGDANSNFLHQSTNFNTSARNGNELTVANSAQGNRENQRNSQNQFQTLPRQSNSQPRKRKSRVSNTSGLIRTSGGASHMTTLDQQQQSNAQLNPSNTHANIMASSNTDLQSQLRIDTGSRAGQGGTTSTTTKQKKKKQQPSQQQTTIDPVEEYLTNAARLQMQMQQLNGIPASSSSTALIAATSNGANEAVAVSNAAQGEQANQNAASPSNRGGANVDAALLQETESLLLTQFKSKCQQEMQSQTKQAIAKLLYSKREALLEIKALQATFKLNNAAGSNMKVSPEDLPRQSSPIQAQSSSTKKQAQTIKQKKESAQSLATQLNELAAKDMIRSHINKAQSELRAEQKEQNEMVEERIDDILVQIQTIVAGLEDSLNERILKIEADQANLSKILSKDRKADLAELESTMKKNLQAVETMSTRALKSLELTKDKLEKGYVTKNVFKIEIERLQKQHTDSIEMPRFAEKNTDDFPSESQLRFVQIEDQLQKLQSAIGDELEQWGVSQAREQEDRFKIFQSKMSRLVQSTVTEAQQEFENVATGVKEDVHSFIQKEMQAREATIESKMEKNKQQFLQAVNSNMRILDNLISDYTTRTHDQIKRQLRSGGSGTGINSRTQLHQSCNQEQDVDEFQSIHGGSSNSGTYRQQVHHQYQKTLEGITGQSLQIVGSLSSVQDVSDTKQLIQGDEELSSQLLSTNRDRQLQAEALQDKLQGTQASNPYATQAETSNKNHLTGQAVPQLNMNGLITPGAKQFSNSERLSQAQSIIPSSSATANQQSPDNNKKQVVTSNDDRQQMPFDYTHTYQNALLNSFKTNSFQQQPNLQVSPQKTAPQQSSQSGLSNSMVPPHPPPSSASPQIIMVEEHKVNHDMLVSEDGYQPEQANFQQQLKPQSASMLVMSPLKMMDNAESSSSQALQQSPDKHPAVIVKLTADPSLLNSHGKVEQSSPIDPAGSSECQSPLKSSDHQLRQDASLFAATCENVLPTTVSQDDKSEQRKQQVAVPIGLQVGQLHKGRTQLEEANAKNSLLVPKADFKQKAQTLELNVVQPVAGKDPRLRNGALHTRQLTQDDIHEEFNEEDGDEQIDFALSNNSPGRVTAGGLPAVQSCDQSDSNDNVGKAAFCGYSNSMQLGASNENRSKSMRQQIQGKGGVMSNRLVNVVSPVYDYNPVSRQRTGTTYQKQETTDSEFWNLTADDNSSQLDAMLIMRNLSNTQLQCSGSTSVIQIHESQENSQYRVRSNEDIVNPAILCDEQQPLAEVQLINNDGQQIIKGDHAHIREFTPLTQFEQRSFDNTPENETIEVVGQGNNRISNFMPHGKSVLTLVTTESEEDEKNLGEEDAPDKSEADSITQGAKISSSNSMTRQEARHSSMVPMMEKNSALLEAEDESQKESPAGKTMAAIANQKYTRGRKPGSDLPTNLQRQGNEIIHQLLLNEVIAALDEVIHLSGDKLNEIILDQQTAITESNRNMIKKARTKMRRVATHTEDGVMLDNSDRYELSGSDSQTVPMDQSGEPDAAQNNSLSDSNNALQRLEEQRLLPALQPIMTLEQRQEELQLLRQAQQSQDDDNEMMMSNEGGNVQDHNLDDHQ